MKNMKIRDTKKRTENKRIREGDYAKPGVTIQGESDQLLRLMRKKRTAVLWYLRICRPKKKKR